MPQKLDALIVGGGAYVIGRDMPNYRGTLAPALLEAVRTQSIGHIGVVTTRQETADQARAAIAALAEDMGIEASISAWSDIEVAKQAVSPQIAVISVPDHLHCPISVPLLEGGIHCLVVKPMADSLQAARAMAAAAGKSRVVAQVEFHKRLDESNLVLRDAISTGRLGQLQYAVIEYSQKKLVPRDVFRDWASKSNIFQYLGVHYVDLLHWATGFMPIKVTAWGQKDYLVTQGVDTWDSMQVMVEWRRTDGGRFVSTHITNWIDPDEKTAMSDQSINVVGTKGRYQADQKRRGIELVTDGQGASHLNPYFTQAYTDPLTGKLRFDGYGIKSVLQFVDDVIAVEDGKVSAQKLMNIRPSFVQCLVSTAVVEAAMTSLSNGSMPMEVGL